MMRLLAVVSFALLLAGCAGDPAGALTVGVRGGEALLKDFASLEATITTIVIPTFQGSVGTGTIRLAPSVTTVDLAKAATPIEVLVAAEVEPASHRSWSLYVSEVKGVLREGGASVDVSGERVQFQQPFEVKAGETASIVGVVDVAKDASGAYTLVAG